MWMSQQVQHLSCKTGSVHARGSTVVPNASLLMHSLVMRTDDLGVYKFLASPFPSVQRVTGTCALRHVCTDVVR